MPRNNAVVPAPRLVHHEQGHDLLLRAQQLVVKGEFTEALHCLKRGADAALASGDDRLALKLANAAAELRATRDLGPGHARRSSGVVAVGAVAHSPLPASRTGRSRKPPPLP